MADGMQVFLPKLIFLELFWQNNNFVFGNETHIIKSLTIKENYGVILNHLPFVIYTSTNTKNLPVTVCAIRVLE